MADLDGTSFAVLPNISDDSDYVPHAMNLLGYLCEFTDLTTPQMRFALALAQFLKQEERKPEFWES